MADRKLLRRHRGDEMKYRVMFVDQIVVIRQPLELIVAEADLERCLVSF